MPFIHNYNEAIKVFDDIENGNCNSKCKTIWVRTFKYALKTKTNPLQLTSSQRKKLIAKIQNVSKKSNPKKNTTLKYKNRNSPPYPANEHCGIQMKGNDNTMYKSIPNKNNICSWRKIK